MAEKPVSRKFNKSVDSGPLAAGESKETQQTIQDERIRRQIQSSIYPKLKEQMKRRMRNGR